MRYFYQNTSKDGTGRVVVDATISVYLAGGYTVASVYAAYSGGVAVNSVTSGSATSSSPGYFSFWVDRGDYSATQQFRIVISKSGFNPQIYDHIKIDNAADYLPSPSAHKTSHQDGGVDEISVTGLSGLLADDQHVLDAEAVSAMGAKANDNPLNHDRYTDAEVLAIAGTPIGSITAYGGTSAPDGFLMCQGAAVSRTTYAALFAIIGTAYGVGDGSTTFNLPDLQQRFPLGKAAAGTGSTLGGTGGAIDHTHTGPSHSHAIQNSATIRGDTVNVDNGVSVQAGILRTISRTAADELYTASATTTAAGTGATGLNNPPFQVVNFIIKT